MKRISELPIIRQAWLMLAVSALLLEGCALFFQYYFGLAPCIMCIYQRVAIGSIFFGGIMGATAPNHLLSRLAGYTFWGIGSIWGLLIAIEHVEMQNEDTSLFFSCEFIPNFPSWAPLHEWIPFLFEATGDCGEISWQFLGYSMPQWMIVVYATYCLALLVIISSRLIKSKSF